MTRVTHNKYLTGKMDNEDLMGCGCLLLVVAFLMTLILGGFVGTIALVTWIIKAIWMA